MSDAGQDICRTAADSQTQVLSIKITKQGGDIRYFTAQVSKFVENFGTVDNVVQGMIHAPASARRREQPGLIHLFGDALDAETASTFSQCSQDEALGGCRAAGRPIDRTLQRRASVAGVLVEKHHVPLKAAIFAAAPDASDSEREQHRAHAYHARCARAVNSISRAARSW
jgi:hypothetical protein